MKHRYNIILIDPPWDYRDKAAAGNRGAGFQYPQMKMNDIHGLNIRLLAAKDCAVFCWTCSPHGTEGMSALTSWGFKYKNKAFSWVKLNKDGTPKMGMGLAGWRANTEDCYMGVTGAMKRVSKSVNQVVFGELGKHSAKPPEVRDRIVELFGDLPRIEIFAREHTPGWDALGLDIGTGDIRDNLALIQLGLDPRLAPDLREHGASFLLHSPRNVMQHMAPKTADEVFEDYNERRLLLRGA